jgi:outer membrane protein OmpA-like peptidoglycan-associated protein
MTSKLVSVVSLFAVALLCGCASKDLVVVIPDSGDGHIGAVVVEASGNKAVLDTAYASATPGSGGAIKTSTTNAQDVNRIFGSAIAARPIAPKSYTLYFKADSDVLLPDSRAAFDDVFTDIGRRKAAEIVVTGHTDTMGERAYNDRLSLERAKAISKLFISRGLAPAAVIAAGRGERDLLIQTPDETPEPRNRRVEITVR